MPTPQNRLKESEKALYQFQLQHPSTQDQSIENKLLQDFEKAEVDLEEYWKQRSRVQWAHLGDRNTRFFHTVATTRRRVNLITQVRNEEGSTVAEEKEIRRVFFRYFKGIYCTEQVEGSDQMANFFKQFENCNLARIAPEAHQSLGKAPSSEEVKETLFLMGLDKAAGPDGITARFLQNN